ncbi:MAG: hypothetical protein M3N13_01525, partial [Candidatus Eremiobacteraeota bacterium]|nr:hypothetical protein [Candidatus Eremiobacteraeota bacterium]
LYYSVNVAGYPLVQMSGFDSIPTVNANFGSGFNSTGQFYVLGAQVYSAVTNTVSVWALSAPLGTGGASTSSTPYSPPGGPVGNTMLAGTGSSIYQISNLCTGQPVLQALSGGPALTLSEFAPGGGCCSPIVSLGGAAEATDGIMYIAGKSVAAGNPNILAFAQPGSIGDVATPTVPLAATALGVALTPDQRFVCVLEAPTTNSGQIQIFQRTPVPTLLSTVALSATSQAVSFSIGP